MNSGARQRGPLDRNGLAALSDLKTEAWNGVFRSLERKQSDFLARQVKRTLPRPHEMPRVDLLESLLAGLRESQRPARAEA